jgi:hypothetical protein
MRDYHKLKVWKKSHSVVLEISTVTKRFTVEYLLVIAKDLKYLDTKLYDQFCESIIEIKKMLSSRILKLRTEH